jgi:hypothetical protein
MATEDRVYEGVFIPKGAIYLRVSLRICLLIHELTRLFVNRKYMVGRVHVTVVLYGNLHCSQGDPT